jgi:hypothetical protein
MATVQSNIQYRFVSQLVAALLTFTVVGDAGARQFPVSVPIEIGIPSATFNFVASAQETEVWCWAASVQMILNYYGLSVTQAEVVSRIFGGPAVTTASDSVISAALNGWGFNKFGRPVTITSWGAPGPPNPAVLLNELSQGHPILLTFQSGPNSGHAVVITAASYFPTPQGPQIVRLIIRDPYPTSVNVQNLGRVDVGGPALGPFIATVRSHWLVRVQ